MEEEVGGVAPRGESGAGMKAGVKRRAKTTLEESG